MSKFEIFLLVSSLVSLGNSVYLIYQNHILTKEYLNCVCEKLNLINELIELHQEILREDEKLKLETLEQNENNKN
jgi:hypothetical protein